MHSFVILQKLLAFEEFLKLSTQRSTAFRLIFERISQHNDVTLSNFCSKHPVAQVCQKLFLLVNIVLKNYCKVKNNKILSLNREKTAIKKIENLPH